MKVFNTQRALKAICILLFCVPTSIEAFGQCPTDANTTISKMDEQCFNAKDGQITFEFTDGIPPDGSTYRKRLWNYDTGKAIYDDNDPFIPGAPTLAIEGNKLIFSNVKPGDYALLLNGGDCSSDPDNPDIYGYGYSGGFSSAIKIKAAIDITIDNTAITTTANTKCAAPFDGEIDMTGAVSGGTGTYEYSIDDGANYQTSAIFSGLEHGFYTVRVRDSNGCIKDENDIEVGDGRVAPAVSITPNPAVVCVDNNLNLNGSPTGGTAPYTHSWTGDIGPLSATNVADPVFNSATTGTFTLTYTVTDDKGCATSETITVTVNQDDASFTYASPFCQNEANPLPSDVVTPGTFSAPAGLVFVDTSTGEIDLAASTAGTYTITYTTAGSCPASSTFDVTIHPAPSSAVLSGDATICAGSSTDLAVTITDGTGPFTIELDNGVGIISNYNSGDAVTVSPAATTTYNLVGEVTDANGCSVAGSGSATVTVLEDPDATLPVSAQDESICEGSGTSILIDNSEDGYSYQLRNNADDSPVGTPVTGTGGQISLPTGNLSVTTTFNIIVDNGACPPVELATLATVVVNPPPSSAVLSGDATICAGSSTDLAVTITDGTGPFTIELDNGVGIISNYNSGDAVTVSPAATTTYNLVGEVTDANGCSVAGSGSATVEVNTLQVFDLSPADLEVCSGEDVIVDLSGSEAGVNYILLLNGNPADTLAGTGAALSFTLADGTFSDSDQLNVLADDGICQVTMNGTTTIHDNERDTSFHYASGTFCNDDPGPVVPESVTTPGGAFSTNDPASLSVDPSTGEIDMAASNIGGPYIVYYTITVGSCVSQDSVEVTITDAPDATFSYDKEKYCQQESDPVPTAGPGASFGRFSVSPAGLVIDSFTGKIDLNASAPGTYTVTNIIESSGSCPGDAYNVLVEVVEEDDASFTYAGPFCQNDPTNPVANISGTTGGTFSAPAGLVFVNTTTGEIDLAASTAGAYTITYTTPGECPDTQTFDIILNPADDPGFSYPDSNFCQSEADPSPDAINTPGGVFSATPGLIFKDSNTNDNSATGEIDLLASTPGDYTITYTTSGECPVSSAFDISIYEVPVADAGNNGNSCTLEYTFEAVPPTVGNGLWSVVSVPPSGTAAASFDNASAIDATVTVSEAGTYRFRWEVSNGACTAAEEIDITFSEPISIVQTASDPGSCDPAQPWGWVPITVSGGSGTTYDILWSNGEGVIGGTGNSGAEDLDGDTPDNPTSGVFSGVYTVKVTDNTTGCEETGIFVVRSSVIADSLSLTGSSVSCNSSLGQINLEYNGMATGPYDIYYINSKADTIKRATKTNFGNGLSTITDEVTDLPADLYYIHVNDVGGGCSVGDTIRISEPDPIVFTFPAGSVDHVTCHDGSDGAIRVDVSGGTPLAGGPPDYTYLWYRDNVAVTDLNMEDPTGLVAGDYYLEVTDGNGCTATSAVVTVTEPAPESAPIASEASSVGCTEFTASWSDESVTDYILDVATDISFDPAFMHPDYDSVIVNGVSLVVNTNIDAGTIYYYRVRAVKSCGLTESSNIITVTTEDVVNTVTQTASNIMCDEFTANWEETATATQYLLEVAEDNAFATMVTGYDPVIVSAGTGKLNVAGLTMGQQYFYRVRVENACGVSDYSSITSVILRDVPGVPTNVVADNITCDRFSLSWNGVNDATTYTVEVYNDELLTNRVYRTAGSSTTAEIKKLSQSTTYYFVVKAANGCGEGEPSVSGSVKTLGPPEAPVISASNPICNGLELMWDVVDNADAYIVELTNLTTNAVMSETVSNSNFTVNTLAAGTSYEVRVRAQNGCGGSNFSDVETITTRLEEECGCGHEKAKFVVNPVNANCVGSDDGALLINLLPVPDAKIAASRFSYKYHSLTNPADSSDWTLGFFNVNTGLVYAFDSLSAGDYIVDIRDNNAQEGEGCEEIISLERTISVQNNITVNTKAETCDGPDGAITLNVPNSCSAAMEYYFIWDNLTDPEVSVNTANNRREATGLAAGDYRIAIANDLDRNIVYDTLLVSVANNCSANGSSDGGGGEPSNCVFVDISFAYTPAGIACYGERGTVTITDLVVAEDSAFTIYLHKVDEDDPYASKRLKIAPSRYIFTDLEKGEYQIQVVQQQPGCGDLVSKRSSAFVIDGPENEFTAEIEKVVEVSVNEPFGDISVGKIAGGGLPYEVRVIANTERMSTEWAEATNNDPATDNYYEHTFTGFEPGIYMVQVKDKSGCILEEKVEVKYKIEVYIPNIFTPNGDGNNDTFKIVNLPLAGDEGGAKMIISNRLGRVIYKSDNYTNDKAWDGGSYSDGVYFYRLTLPNAGGAYSGWVEIWRGKIP